ncbi:SET and MYND domain-containing protein 4-like [Penaeus japonicus]|uniref:SET and MYND domain-containing protein 4-like n=1 Tax=Penaeus japonicus TaxID=27405 RepID=UPI001C71270D|nr:SET and MYND domain-containing protein 4-like [Penaeus japonicus]
MKEKPAAMDSSPNITSLISDFITLLQTSGKSREVFEHVGPSHSEEDMFSYLWSLQEAHQSLTPTPVSAKKSQDIAESWLERGEKELFQGNLEEALESYSLSILFAPHPPLPGGPGGSDVDRLDCPDRNNNFDILIADEGKEEGRRRTYRDFDLLARGYGGRSAVLFEAGHYRKCILDIDAASNYSADESHREPLAERRAKCLARLKAEEENGKIPAKKKLAKLSDSAGSEAPELPDPHPAIPALGKVVRMAFAPSQGRYLIAGRDIGPGETVCVEKSYCSALHAQHLLTHCCVCLLRSLTPLPCPFCTAVIFCSEACRTEGLAGCHWQECNILPTLVNLDMGANSLLAYRIITHTSYATLKDLLLVLKSEECTKPPETIGFDEDGRYISSSYRPVYHLVTNRKQRPPTDLLRRCIQAFVITKLLLESGRYFVKDDSGAFDPTLDDIVLVGSALVHHMMNLLCNAYAIGELQVDVSDSRQSRMEARGGGVFVASSLLNHSCNPSIAAFSHGRTQVLRTVRHVPAGHALTYNYGSFYCTEDEDVRRAGLLKQYSFTCGCEACENGWYDSFRLSSELVLDCPKCSAMSSDQSRHSCECMAVKKRIERTAEDFDAIYLKILHRNASFHDLVMLIDVIKLMEKWVKLPSKDYFYAQELLKFYFDTKGSRVYV